MTPEKKEDKDDTEQDHTEENDTKVDDKKNEEVKNTPDISVHPKIPPVFEEQSESEAETDYSIKSKFFLKSPLD